MAGDTDFLALFQELGLSAGCGLDELKLAFRRRVAQLHPDRNIGEGNVVEGAEARLQRLTAVYGAALDFHRQHGRLPGFAASPQRATPTPPPRSVRHTPPPMTIAQPVAPSWSIYLSLIIVAALLLGFWVFDSPEDEEARTAAEQAQNVSSPAVFAAAAQPRITREPPAPAQAPVGHRRLLVGMDRSDALVLQGQPVSESEDRWEYGPSWIAFKCDKISDWYSSPLRPLHAETTHPKASDALLLPVLHDGECVPLPKP